MVNTEREIELIKGCLQGSIKYQELLYRHYYGYGMAISLRYTVNADEASEILNDSFLKVFAKISQYDETKSFKAWLRRIIVNTAIDYYRRNQKHLHQQDITEVRGLETDFDVIGELSAADIIKLVQQLPDPYRITFNLYEIEGYSHEEISEQLNIPVGTSRSNLSRAKSKLRDLLKKNLGIAYEQSSR